MTCFVGAKAFILAHIVNKMCSIGAVILVTV